MVSGIMLIESTFVRNRAFIAKVHYKTETCHDCAFGESRWQNYKYADGAGRPGHDLLDFTILSCTVKKSVKFTVKYLATSCQSISRYLHGRLLVEHFWRSCYGRVMLTDNT